MKTFVASLLLFLVACASPKAAPAQTTTTYTQQYAVGGTATYPVRVFSVTFDQGADSFWLEYVTTPFSYGYPHCDAATNGDHGYGFIFLEGTVIGADEQCWALSSANGSSVTFSGTAEDGHHFDAVYTYTYTTTRRCGGSGRGGSCHTVYTFSNGVLVVTKH
jgi:hypothetical protein